MGEPKLPGTVLRGDIDVGGDRGRVNLWNRNVPTEALGLHSVYSEVKESGKPTL